MMMNTNSPTRWIRSVVTLFGIGLALARCPMMVAAVTDEPNVRLSAPAPAESVQDPPQPDAVTLTNSAATEYATPATKPAQSPQPYKGTGLRDTNFSYLEDPANTAPYQPFDELKRIRLGDCLRLDLGGEYRLRYHDEHNMRLRGEESDFMLSRLRLYSDLWYDETVRFYAEYLDAVSLGEDVAPRSTDEDRSDFLQIFAEAQLCDLCGGPLSLRGGRQEMYYGSERLLSSPDWSNVRRSFEGATLFWKRSDWNVDAFWMQPDIPVDPHQFDSPDSQRQFAGVFATYRGIKDETVDLYYIVLDEQDAENGFVQSITGTPGDFRTHTIGSRWEGSDAQWLWELEGAVQFGDFAAIDHRAAMVTAGLGHKCPCIPENTTVWIYYDFASGDSNPNDGRRETFDQLFPSGHRYLGWQDLIGRQNIHDLNFRFSTNPHERLEFVAWYHIFHLDEPRDNLYNATGRILRKADPSGSDSTDVGQEIDLTLSIKITPRAQWLFGYSHFFSGDFIRESAAANGGSRSDVDFFYSQLGVRF